MSYRAMHFQIDWKSSVSSARSGVTSEYLLVHVCGYMQAVGEKKAKMFRQ